MYCTLSGAEHTSSFQKILRNICIYIYIYIYIYVELLTYVYVYILVCVILFWRFCNDELMTHICITLNICTIFSMKSMFLLSKVF